MAKLEGKVAIITGGARGQGAAEAALFVKEGAKVVITDVLTEEGEKLSAELGQNVLFLKQDVTQEESWIGVVKMTVEHFGKVDILINNAGIIRMAPLVSTTLEDYMAVTNVNQVGVFLGMKSVVVAAIMVYWKYREVNKEKLETPIEKEIEIRPHEPCLGLLQGSFVVFLWIDHRLGLVGMTMATAYVASKFAVRGMTKVAALELGQFGIRVNSIHPGGVATPMLEIPGLEIDPEDNVFNSVQLF